MRKLDARTICQDIEHLLEETCQTLSWCPTLKNHDMGKMILLVANKELI